jgi:DNA-directed RNA polymerase subunit RPC12/RpoP
MAVPELRERAGHAIRRKGGGTMAQRLVGRFHGEPVFDNDDWDSEARCPSCGLNAGEKDETHSNAGTQYFTCSACGHEWQENADYEPEVCGFHDLEETDT